MQYGKGEEIKNTQIGKEEIKLFQFTNDIIIYVKNLKELRKKSPEVRNDHSNVSRYKVNIQKSLLFHILANELWNLKLKTQCR